MVPYKYMRIYAYVHTFILYLCGCACEREYVCVCAYVCVYARARACMHACVRIRFQYMFGEMDKDGTKSISLQEFVEYYSEFHAEAQSEVLSIEDDDAAPRKSRLDTGNVELAYKKKEDFQAPGPSGTIGELFKKWSGADGGQKGKKANSVDFKEFTAMLKSLNLKVDRHKAQEIFRQVRRSRYVCIPLASYVFALQHAWARSLNDSSL